MPTHLSSILVCNPNAFIDDIIPHEIVCHIPSFVKLRPIK